MEFELLADEFIRLIDKEIGVPNDVFGGTVWIPRSQFPRILSKNYANYPGPNGVTQIGIYLKDGK